jgi:hypothetical protein
MGLAWGNVRAASMKRNKPRASLQKLQKKLLISQQPLYICSR